MSQYQFRYFFDPGSGICLWSANDQARERFSYSVDLGYLKLPENLLRKGDYILAWFDTSIDWDYPPDPSPWSQEERLRFNEAAQSFLQSLRQYLGLNFEIIDESGTSHA